MVPYKVGQYKVVQGKVGRCKKVESRNSLGLAPAPGATKHGALLLGAIMTRSTIPRFAGSLLVVGAFLVVSGVLAPLVVAADEKTDPAPRADKLGSPSASSPSHFGNEKSGSLGAPGTQHSDLAPANAPLPSGAAIVARLKATHPRLLADAADFARLRQQTQTQPLLHQWREALQQEGQRLLTEPVSRYDIPDGVRLLSTSKRVVRRLSTLGMLYQLEKDDLAASAYEQRAWQELQAAARFPDWNPRHFLDTAEMTYAFALGYDWFYEAWTPEQRAVIRTALLEKGLRPGLLRYRHQSKDDWWVDNLANWNQVCNSGLGLGALAIGDEAPKEAGEVLHSILWSLPPSLRQLGPDGGTSEGPSYWEYGVSYATILMAALRSAIGEDFGLSHSAGFERTGFFPIYMSGPTGRAFNFSDGSDDLAGIPGLFWLVEQFHQPAFATYRWQHLAAAQSQHQAGRLTALDLLWAADLLNSYPKPDAALSQNTASNVPANPSALAARPPSSSLASLPLGAYFRGTEVFTWRSAWDDADALFFALRAGDNRGDHSHLDLGSFVLEARGQRWALDLGGENYNVPGYFTGQRRDYYRVRAEGHNTLVLNPGNGPDQEPALARIVRHNISETAAFAITDLTPAYAPTATSVQRGIAYVAPGAVLVQDEIKATEAVDAWWFLHTAARIKLTGNKRSALLLQGGEQLLLRIVSPQKAAFEVQRAQPLAQSPHPTEQSPNPVINKLTIHLPDTKDERIVVLMAPVINAPTLPDVQVKVKPLDEWQ